jgi:hypothetical protein
MMKKTIKTRSFQKLLIVFLLISIVSISGCNLDLSKGLDGKTEETDPDEFITKSVETHFSIYLPSAINSGERVALEILDEVTGLPYNSRLYDMKLVNDQEYSLDLSLPTGSVIKYRYVRIGTTITPEVTISGDEVRYRLLYINGETTVSDSLQCWQDTPPSLETGSLSGTVMDSTSQQPLADILISVGGNLTFTDANGRFNINRITPGIQNVVFYAMDGQYQAYQQGAAIVSGLTTVATVQLVSQPLVEVTFHVTGPNDAMGIPVYLAGNLIQLGNTFTDLNGGMSIKPKQMPMLTPQEDGSFLLTLDLYAGTDLRYKFTLGDGYWNAEHTAAGAHNIRQLIVPDHSVTLDLTVASWRSPGFEPITFNISIPPETSPGDEKYIQLKTGTWTEPLPLWPLGDDNYIYIVFSPLDVSLPIAYRFCRNEDCEQALNAESLVSESNIQPAEIPQSVQVTLTEWQNWQPISQPTEVVAANIPVKSESFQTWIELTPEMNPSWRVYAPIGISTLSEIGAGTVLLSPQWFISPEDGYVVPSMGETPFKADLVSLSESINAFGMESGLFPRLAPTNTIQTFWSSQTHSETWWQNWFRSYRQFILNYAQIAAETQAGWFVIGGKDVMPAFPGGVFADGSASDVPEDFDEQWLQLISDIRSIYSGKLVWATNAQVSMDPLPHFINMTDALYITIDSPIASTSYPSLEDLSYNFEAVINTQIYETYESTQKPIIIALAYPSIEGASTGCTLLDSDCSNDGVFLEDEVTDRIVNLDEQVSIYNATLPILSNQDWINGIAIRGYDPTIVKLDGTSSVTGKPAQDVIWYWFSGLITE